MKLKKNSQLKCYLSKSIGNEEDPHWFKGMADNTELGWSKVVLGPPHALAAADDRGFFWDPFHASLLGFQVRGWFRERYGWMMRPGRVKGS